MQELVTPKLSVIIPAYNATKTIGRCVDSIITCHSPLLEIIIINDGSKDSTGEVCSSMIEKDERIKYVEKANTGVSDTRNVGIKIAKGEWVMFSDADDWYTEDAFDFVLGELSNLNQEINVLFFPYFQDTESGTKVCRYDGIDDTIRGERFEIEKIKENVWKYYWNSFINPVWNKCFKRKQIIEKNNTFDPSMTMGEDAVFVLEFLSDEIFGKYIDTPIYHHYIELTVDRATGRRHKNYKMMILRLFNEMDKFSCFKAEKNEYFVVSWMDAIRHVAYHSNYAKSECDTLKKHPNTKTVLRSLNANTPMRVNIEIVLIKLIGMKKYFSLLRMRNSRHEK